MTSDGVASTAAPCTLRHAHHTHRHTEHPSTQAFPHFSPSTELVYVSTISVFISVTRNRCTQPLYKASLQPPVHRQERGGGDWTRAASFPRSWVGGLLGGVGRGERESGKGRRGAALASNCAASLATHLRWEPSVLAHAQIAWSMRGPTRADVEVYLVIVLSTAMVAAGAAWLRTACWLA